MEFIRNERIAKQEFSTLILRVDLRFGKIFKL